MSTKGKTLTTLGIIGLVAVLIFIYAVANSAQNMAQDNRDMISPHLDTTLIAGGPTELKDLFKEAVGEEKDPAKIEPQYVWLTVLVENAGVNEVEEIATSVSLDTKIHKIYTTVKPTRYYGGVEVVEKKKNQAKFTLHSVGKDESFAVFLGLQPEAFEGEPPFDQKERQLWRRDYRIFFQKVRLTAGDFEKIIY